MARHDVFVFPLPSIFEAFGLVILEAMSQVLPVITVPETAGPDLIDDSKNGFIVPIRSAEAIAQRLDLLSIDLCLLAEMKQVARAAAVANERCHYCASVAALVAGLVGVNKVQQRPV